MLGDNDEEQGHDMPRPLPRVPPQDQYPTQRSPAVPVRAPTERKMSRRSDLPNHPSSSQRSSAIPQVRTDVKAISDAGFQLNGMVFGLSGSGKRTLLQRLEGKEPDFNAPRRRSKGTGDVDPKSEESVVASAPYLASPNWPMWEDRIQLKVQATRKASKNNSANVDFYVVLIDPRHDRTKLGKYLAKSLHAALRNQGYGRDLPKRPFCLCLLRNFRDLIPSDDVGCISESDLTAWTMEILESYPDMDPACLVLQCTNTSLFNCFGLGLLHHFIYQTYLQRKQYDIDRELRAVQEAAARSRHEAPAVASYDNYMLEIERLTSSNGGRPRHRNDDETATTATSSGAGRRKIIPQRESSSSRRRASSGGSCSTLPSIQQSLENAKDALEAFLESDSDEDDDVRHQDAGSDDSDEDDLFYDESGLRNDAKRFSSKDKHSFSENIPHYADKEFKTISRNDFVGNEDSNSGESGSKIDESSQSDRLLIADASQEREATRSTELVQRSLESCTIINASGNCDARQIIDDDVTILDEEAKDEKDNQIRLTYKNGAQSLVSEPKTQSIVSDGESGFSSQRKIDEENNSDSEFFIDEDTALPGSGASDTENIDEQERRATSGGARNPSTNTITLAGQYLNAHQWQSNDSEEATISPLTTSDIEIHIKSETCKNEIGESDNVLADDEMVQAPKNVHRSVRDEASSGKLSEVGGALLSQQKGGMPRCSQTGPASKYVAGVTQLAAHEMECIRDNKNVVTEVDTKKFCKSEDETTAKDECMAKAASDVTHVEKPVAARSQLSDAARAAIAAAKEDFERMLQETEDDERSKKSEKKTSEEGKREKKKKVKKVKREKEQ